MWVENQHFHLHEAEGKTTDTDEHHRPIKAKRYKGEKIYPISVIPLDPFMGDPFNKRSSLRYCDDSLNLVRFSRGVRHPSP